MTLKPIFEAFDQDKAQGFMERIIHRDRGPYDDRPVLGPSRRRAGLHRDTSSEPSSSVPGRPLGHAHLMTLERDQAGNQGIFACRNKHGIHLPRIDFDRATAQRGHGVQ